MRIRSSWGGMRYSAPSSVITAISSTEMSFSPLPSGPWTSQAKNPSKANVCPEKTQRVGGRLFPLPAGRGRADVVDEVADGMSGPPLHRERVGLLHPPALGQNHVIAADSRLHGDQGGAVSPPGLLPFLQSLWWSRGFAGTQDVGKALVVRAPDLRP